MVSELVTSSMASSSKFAFVASSSSGGSQSASAVTFMASSSSTVPSTGQQGVSSGVSFSSSLVPLSLKLDRNNFAY